MTIREKVAVMTGTSEGIGRQNPLTLIAASANPAVSGRADIHPAYPS